MTKSTSFYVDNFSANFIDVMSSNVDGFFSINYIDQILGNSFAKSIQMYDNPKLKIHTMNLVHF